MNGLGERLKARARSLDLTDSEVARRLGLSQNRYSNYCNNVVEPDLATLARVVQVLGMTADEALGIAPAGEQDEAEVLRARIALAAETMDPAALRAAAAMFDPAAKAIRPAGVKRRKQV